MVRLVFIIIILLYSFNSFSEELNINEKAFLSFVDLNNDQHINLDEINKVIKLIFNLIDKNHDGQISDLEILELKSIINTLS